MSLGFGVLSGMELLSAGAPEQEGQYPMFNIQRPATGVLEQRGREAGSIPIMCRRVSATQGHPYIPTGSFARIGYLVNDPRRTLEAPASVAGDKQTALSLASEQVGHVWDRR
jgi:hypothetical protein